MAEDVHEFTGNLTRNPEIRYTQNGLAVTSFTIANTPRRLVNQTWQDGTPLFLRVTCWDKLAENVAASIAQGTAVKVTGTLSKGKDWTDKNTGQQRSGELEITASDVQVSLRSQKLQQPPVKSYKENGGGRGGNGGGGNYGNNGGGNYSAPEQSVSDDEVPF